MKLHTYETRVDGKTFTAVTNSKRHQYLRAEITLEGGYKISGDDWHFINTIDYPDDEPHEYSSHPDFIKSGCVMGMATPITVYVFEFEYTRAIIRVFTKDHDAARYHAWIRKNGDSFKLEPVKTTPLPSITIGGKLDAIGHGISHYPVFLQSYAELGFYMEVIKEFDIKQDMERSVLKKVRESGWAEKLGIRIIDFQIKEIRVGNQSPARSATLDEDVKKLDAQLRRRK